MQKNKYSKFRYENNFNLKYSVNPYTKQPQFLNTELKTIKPEISPNFVGNNLNTNKTIITNYVYSCTQVNQFDQPIAPSNASNTIKMIFFSLFNF